MRQTYILMVLFFFKFIKFYPLRLWQKRPPFALVGDLKNTFYALGSWKVTSEYLFFMWPFVFQFFYYFIFNQLIFPATSFFNKMYSVPLKE